MSDFGVDNTRFKNRLHADILMHERIGHERKEELYGVLLFCITAVQQRLTQFFKIHIRRRCCPEKWEILGSNITLLRAPRSSLSSSCSFHDAPRQPIAPSF